MPKKKIRHVKPQAIRKTKCLSFWFSEEEAQRIKLAADRVPVSRWGRDCLLSMAAMP